MKYLTFFSTPEERELRLATAPPGVNKSAYMAHLLRETGRSVEILSPAWSKCDRWRCWQSFDRVLGDGITLHQLATFGTPLRWLTPLQGVYSLIQLFFYLLFHTQAGEPVLVYHSYYLSLPILAAKKIKNFKLILEVEEIYQDIVQLHKGVERLEWKMIRAADAYVFSTSAIGKIINRDSVPAMVVNGSYQWGERADAEPPDDKKIHCLYSGTLDEVKGGAGIAVEAAAFLPANYCIHISGLGNDAQVQRLLQKIEHVQQNTQCQIVYEGFLDDKAYKDLLAKCQIGLNTQTPDQRFSDTCFPSKILVYMANGLQVVSADNKAITDSDVGARLTYYDSQTPEAVAQAIQCADPARGADNIQFVQRLHQRACSRMAELLSQL